MPKHYTFLLADRSTGVVRRFTLAIRPAAFVLIGVLLLPILIGLGIRWSARAELSYLRARNRTLEVENANFRVATGELTTQIWSLQDAVTDLTEQSLVDFSTQTAMARLPEGLRNQALGGVPQPGALEASVGSASVAPPDTFSVLRSMLSVVQRDVDTLRPSLEQRAALAGATPSIWPSFGWLTSGYGYRRDPFTAQRASHLGLDISGKSGDSVKVTADGTVSAAGWEGGYGQLVAVSHGFGMETRYAHLSRISVRPGQAVKRGDTLGTVGSTGRSTSPHLHYEVWINGRPVNPVQLLAARAAR
jgi:murein DD-endopeptidase MepM/ murein hydrolase activator NlpD